MSGAIGWLSILLVVLPVVTGAMAGAGLFGREMERGTHVFALSQHTSRLRWWATGMLVAGAPPSPWRWGCSPWSRRWLCGRSRACTPAAC